MLTGDEALGWDPGMEPPGMHDSSCICPTSNPMQATLSQHSLIFIFESEERVAEAVAAHEDVTMSMQALGVLRGPRGQGGTGAAGAAAAAGAQLQQQQQWQQQLLPGGVAGTHQAVGHRPEDLAAPVGHPDRVPADGLPLHHSSLGPRPPAHPALAGSPASGAETRAVAGIAAAATTAAAVPAGPEVAGLSRGALLAGSEVRAAGQGSTSTDTTRDSPDTGALERVLAEMEAEDMRGSHA